MSITLDLPEGLTLSEGELKWQLAARLFEQGMITSGEGAQIVGVSKHQFITGLGRFNVTVFQVDEDRLAPSKD